VCGTNPGSELHSTALCQRAQSQRSIQCLPWQRKFAVPFVVEEAIDYIGGGLNSGPTITIQRLASLNHEPRPFGSMRVC